MWASNPQHKYPSIITDNVADVKIKGPTVIDGDGFVQVSGNEHVLALLDSGKVVSFGRNTYGKLGINNTTNQTIPAEVITSIYYNGKNAIAVAAGYNHSLILLNSGRVLSFGKNDVGQLGDGKTTDRYSPVIVTIIGTGNDYDGSNAIAITAGENHSMILLNTGKVLAFGWNIYGQLGDGTVTSINTPVAVSTDSSNGNDYDGSNAIAISAGARHSLILLNTGKVVSFGRNFNGELGDGSNTDRNTPVAVSTTTDYNGSNAIAISTSSYYSSMILLNTGKVLSFGNNTEGELGDGSTTDRNIPTPVSNGDGYDGTNAIGISAGYNMGGILLNYGKVLLFGNNSNGQLGDGTTTTRTTPNAVSTTIDYDGYNAVSVNCLRLYTIIILNSGKALSCGKNFHGRLGNGTLSTSSNQLLGGLQSQQNKFTQISTYNCGGNLGINKEYPKGKIHIKQSKDAVDEDDLGDGLVLDTFQTNISGSYKFKWNFSVDENGGLYIVNNSLSSGNSGIKISSTGTLSNITFTGQHLNLLNKNIDSSYYGLIVSSTGKYINLDNELRPKINEALPICTITNIDNDKKVFGVISNKEDDKRTHTDGNIVSLMSKYNKNERRMRINSLGEGGVWVSNKNGNFENGDYITSSSIPGYGTKQIVNEDLVTEYTVAKITCDCDFNLNKIIKQKLKIINETDSNNNIIKNIDYNENGDLQYEDDLDDSGNQQLIYKFNTRFLLIDGTQITKEEYDDKLLLNEEVYIACFVGCTYHCG
jgi:alpha-tubulin suppressor-like RCC1 family protein